MSPIDISYCILLLSGAFALIALGLLFIRSSTAINQATVLMQMLETTVTKLNTVLDDVNNKLELMNAPIELINGIFSRRSMKAGLLSGFGILTSIFRRKKKERR